MPRNIKYLDRILELRNFVGCASCRKDCKVDPLVCKVCCKWFHRKCEGKKAIMAKKSYCDYQLRNDFICSNKCYNSILPFSSIDDIGVISTTLGDGKDLCRKCKRDCLKK